MNAGGDDDEKEARSVDEEIFEDRSSSL